MNLIWVLVLMIFNNGHFSQGVSTNTSKRPEVVNIGSIITFNSAIGKVAKVALKAAIEDVNSDPAILGGTKLKMTMLNSNHSGFLSIAQALKFMETDTVAIIGPQASDLAHVISHIANELQVPLLSFSATDPTLSSLQYPFFVRTSQNDLFQMAAIADIVQYYEWREVIAIYVDDDYGRNGISALADQLAMKRCQIVLFSLQTKPFTFTIHLSVSLFLTPTPTSSLSLSLSTATMVVAELSPSYTKTSLHSSQLSFFSSRLSDHRRISLPRPQNGRRVVCSVASNQVQAPSPVQTEEAKTKGDCYGVFCLTYDLEAEEDETKSWKKLINIAVSGAAGMISNHLLFKLASGEVFGPDQPIALKLLGSERSLQALEGVAMELEDSLFPLLREVNIGIDPYDVFQDVEWALLIGAKPRGPGMERAGLLDINGQIFAEQGKALNAVASRNVKVMVVGNPCNTNALICLKNAPNIPAKNFHALTRLDENRAKCQLALKAGVFYDKVSNVTIWGNHSTTQVPDFLNARINGIPVKEVIKDTKWLEEEFTEKVQNRGGVLIKKWGRSSAASTAVSIVDAIRSLVTPTPEGDWFSSGVYTNGNPYGIAEDLVFSMPCRSKGDGDYELVKDVIFDDYLLRRVTKSEAELLAEKRCVAHLTGEGIAVCDLPEDTMLPGEV